MDFLFQSMFLPLEFLWKVALFVKFVIFNAAVAEMLQINNLKRSDCCSCLDIFSEEMGLRRWFQIFIDLPLLGSHARLMTHY